MQLALIKNPDESKKIVYTIARIIYAETHAVSLHVVEALASMIKNFHVSSGLDFKEIVSDKDIFESLNENSENNDLLSIDANDRKFQMCLRVVSRMLQNSLPDSCCGATRFHRADRMPSWAVSRGYIADIDGLLFYL